MKLSGLMFFGAKTIANEILLVEMKSPSGGDAGDSDLLVKTANEGLVKDVELAIRAMFGQ